MSVLRRSKAQHSVTAAMRKQVIVLAMTATAAQAWVPLPSFSGLTRGLGVSNVAAPVRCAWRELLAWRNSVCHCLCVDADMNNGPIHFRA